MNKVPNKDVERTVQALIVANVTVDETYAVPTTPRPGESLIGEYRSRDVGGKGANVATVLARCGVATRLMAAVGQDERGEYVRLELSHESMQSHLVTVLQYPTDLSLIYTDANGENSIVTTVAATQSLDVSQAAHAMDTLQSPGFLVLQGNLTQEKTHRLIDDARSRGVAVVLNPSPCIDWLKDTLPLADILILNEGEAETLVGLSDEAAVRALLQQGPTQVVLTRGGNGALLGTRAATITGTNDTVIGSANAATEPDITIEPMSAVAANVVDTTGAGDTYLGVALGSAILRGTALDALALRHAAEAAAITVSRYGTRSAFPDEPALAAILAGR